MSRTIFCKKYQQQLEGLDRPPLPGKEGEEIFEQVSKKAWRDWQMLQVMLINEKQLSLADKEARAWLTSQMHKFFANEATEQPQGYQEK